MAKLEKTVSKLAYNGALFQPVNPEKDLTVEHTGPDWNSFKVQAINNGLRLCVVHRLWKEISERNRHVFHIYLDNKAQIFHRSSSYISDATLESLLTEET